MGADRFSEDGQLEPYKEAIFNILTSNSDLLRQSRTTCFKPNSQRLTFQSSDICSGFRYHSTLKRRTHLSFITNGNVASNVSHGISLLTQMTLDRFHTFERLAQNWEGPISAACYVTEDEANKLPNMVLQSNVLKKRKNVEIHLVFIRDVSGESLFVIGMARD